MREILVDFFPLNSNKNIFRIVHVSRNKYALGQMREKLDKKRKQSARIEARSGSGMDTHRYAFVIASRGS